MNKGLKTDANGDVWLARNQLSRKMSVLVKNKAKLILTERLASMIGFDKKEMLITKNTEAPLPVDLEAGFHAMYVYTDLLSHSE